MIYSWISRLSRADLEKYSERESERDQREANRRKHMTNAFEKVGRKGMEFNTLHTKVYSLI